MKERLIGGFIVGVVTLVVLFCGGLTAAVILAAVSIMAIYEFMKLYKMEQSAFSALNYIATAGVYLLLYFGQSQYLFPFIVLYILVTLSIYVIRFPMYKDYHVEKSIFVFLYATVLLSYVFRVRSMESGAFYFVFILISSWGNDICAYFVGSAIGKHKFSPKVSPNKSVEGFIGGIAGAFILGYLYAIVFRQFIEFSLSPLYSGIIAALGCIPAVIGDLAASAIKRDNEIKDYGDLIPGHGGIVDRIDSLLFTAPIIYYLIILFSIL